MSDSLADELKAVRYEVHEELRLQEVRMQKLWRKPLVERVAAGRSLGPLRLDSLDGERGMAHFQVPREDFAFFRERERVRLSRDSPETDFVSAELIGLTDKGLTFSCASAAGLGLSERDGWTIDEDLVDLSRFYLKAIDALGETEHGRDEVCPVLFGEPESEIDFGIYDEVLDGFEGADIPMDESQADAVATCLASSPFHLVQGPPGTGKTHTLVRLVEQLVEQGHRVLLTAFTHRAIHHALAKVHELLGDRCPVVKISDPVVGEQFPFKVFSDLEASQLVDHDGPYVIGATPFALWSFRLAAAHFDSAVLDETSQLTLPSAAMVMLKSDRWFFFGDHRQLPPVSLMHQDDPTRASVFARLARQCKPTTLNTTYRMNEPLTRWPSESFYSGELAAAAAVAGHRLALKSVARSYPQLLGAEPCLLRVELDHHGAKSRSDEEAELAADLVRDLLASGLRAEEIGIVVPFRAQAGRIRTLLRGDRFSEAGRAVTVDTVERFQGQEREVVICSFASSDFLFLEKLGGFLFQAQRLNVAVTRARTKVLLLHSVALREYAEAMRSRWEGAAILMSLFESATLVGDHR
ncbi:MAG: DNA replication ATP-dependent helicase Dna2 [Verrucomicrobiales bacterium]|jgi:DNA replication ATP-dependent helicase Dna2